MYFLLGSCYQRPTLHYIRVLTPRTMVKEMGEREKKKIERAKAPPSAELRHFLLGYPPLMTSAGKRRDGGEEKVNAKLAESIRACSPEGWGVASYNDL